MHKFQAIFLLVLAGLLWSLNGLVIKSITWNPISIAGGLCLFAAALQILYLRRIPILSGRVLQLGVVLYVANTFLFVSAMQLTSVANTLLLQAASPVYVAILGPVLLREPSKVKDWFSIVFIILGTWLFFLDEMSSPQFLGTCLAALSGISNAGYAICLRKLKKSDPLDIVVWGNIGVFLLSTPFILGESMTLGNISLVALLGIVLYGISFIAYCEAIKHLRAIEALLLGCLELVFGPVWAYLFLSEYPGINAVKGGSLIFLVVLLYSVSVIRDEGKA